MKKLALLLIISFSVLTFGQDKKNEYTTKHGISYKIGDTITLGRGSGTNGRFIYLQMGGWYSTLALLDGDIETANMGIGKELGGLGVVVKKIKTQKLNGIEKTYLVVDGGDLTNYYLYIDNAIISGEVVSNFMTSDVALNELKKAKDKLDLDLISKDEYDVIKNDLKKYIK